MWSSERPAGRGLTGLFFPALMLASVGLAGCTVTPLYAPAAPGIVPVTAALPAIAIEPPRGRVEQIVRNKLDFSFTGGGDPAPPRYSLRLSATVSETGLGVTPIDVAPSFSINVGVSYELAEIQTGRVITRGTAHGVASFDRSNQGFATTRARIEAEERAATAAAEDLRTRIVTALAVGR